MRGKKLTTIIRQSAAIIATVVLGFASVRTKAQSTPPTTPADEPKVQSTAQTNQSSPQVMDGATANVPPAPTAPTDSIDNRIERARALAAAHQLDAAATELETARATTRDAVVRQGTSIMLMGIYLEAGNYSRAQSLLEETFQTRLSEKNGSIRNYFALAGQAVNGVRLHLGRYRNYGVNIEGATLPPEAVQDLERARSLLERMGAQAKEIMKDSSMANDGLALLEDVLGIRLTLARDAEDRDKWQAEYAQAREQLGSGRVQIASLGGLPSRRPQNQPSPTQTPEKTPANSEGAPAVGNTAETKTIDAGSLNERAARRIVPVYPKIAKQQRSVGTVRVHVIVNESGEVEITKSEGPMLLRQAAEEAARGWRFSPVYVDGRVVKLAGYIDFDFTL